MLRNVSLTSSRPAYYGDMENIYVNLLIFENVTSNIQKFILVYIHVVLRLN